MELNNRDIKIEAMINKLELIKDQWTIGFHIHPKHSVPQLHMRVISTDPNIMNKKVYARETKSFTEQDGKFVSTITVLKYLSGKYNEQYEVLQLNEKITEWREN